VLGLPGCVKQIADGAREMPAVNDDMADMVTRQALRDLVATMARATDRADPDLMLSVMHPDAVMASGLDGVGADYARALTEMVRAHLARCFHSIGTQYFEVDGDRAAGESYVVAYSLAAGETPQETLTGGRYLDRFERRGGAWKLASRQFVQDWATSRPADREPAGLGGGYAPDDPSVAFWAQR